MADIAAIGSFSVNYERSLLFSVPSCFFHSIIFLHHIHKKNVSPIDEIWAIIVSHEHSSVTPHWHCVFFLKFPLCASHTVTRDSLMSAKLWSLSEILAAFVTHKRSLTSVCPYMIVQSCSAGKRTRTVAALEWLLTGMTDSMCTQLGGMWEALRAVSALIWLLWRLVTDVNLQHGSLWKGLLALTALPQAQLSDVAEYGLTLSWSFVQSFFSRDGWGRVATLAFWRRQRVRLISRQLLLKYQVLRLFRASHSRGKVEGRRNFSLKTVKWLTTDCSGRRWLLLTP